MSTQNRQPKGTPTGGQFAEQTRPSPDLALEAAETAPEGIEPWEVVDGIYSGKDWDADAIGERDGWGYKQWEQYEDAREAAEIEQAARGVREHEGVTAQLHTSEIDDAVVVQVDTDELTAGRKVRVYINDGAVYDGDPEKDSTAHPALNLADLEAMSKVSDMMAREAKVRWVGEGDTVHEGVVRHGTWDADLQPRTFDDIRDARVRITTLAGMETTMAFTHMAQLASRGELAAD